MLVTSQSSKECNIKFETRQHHASRQTLAEYTARSLELAQTARQSDGKAIWSAADNGAAVPCPGRVPAAGRRTQISSRWIIIST